MNTFCSCRNIYFLKKNPKNNDNYENYCNICDVFVKIDGPILYEVNNIRKDEKKNINKIRAAIYDETYITAKKPCIQCGNSELRFFHNESLKRIYVCPECKSYYL